MWEGERVDWENRFTRKSEGRYPTWRFVVRSEARRLCCSLVPVDRQVQKSVGLPRLGWPELAHRFLYTHHPFFFVVLCTPPEARCAPLGLLFVFREFLPSMLLRQLATGSPSFCRSTTAVRNDLGVPRLRRNWTIALSCESTLSSRQGRRYLQVLCAFLLQPSIASVSVS